ncbi:MAG TPA: hypothetical protein VMB74_04590 [Streptosporangiaceae bacterium]|nr:hypothetical protein [Streptosporangiaceae bacterium]
MGLMDRVKAQAAQLAQQAQDAAQEGKNRLDQAQAGRRGDMLLRQLGVLVFAERTGRGTADSQARIDQLISDISAHESQNGLNLTDPPQGGFGQSLFGQQPSAGQGAQGPSGFGQQPPADQGMPGESSGFGQQPPGQQPGFPSGPEQPGTEPGGPGTMPSVDTTTSFFPPPEDDAR